MEEYKNYILTEKQRIIDKLRKEKVNPLLTKEQIIKNIQSLYLRAEELRGNCED
jgi:hypothetical protein